MASISNKLLLRLVSPLWALAMSGPVCALDFVWQGGSGDWTSAHWGRGGAPLAPGQASHNVSIDDGNPIDSVVTVSGLRNVGALTISAGDHLTVANGALLFVSGAITNNGLLSLDSTGSSTFLTPLNDTTLSGTGETRLGANPANQLSGVLGKQLMIDAGHTVSGGGAVLMSRILNLGTIHATSASGMGLAGTGQAGSIDNTGGLIDVADGSSVSFSYGQVTGALCAAAVVRALRAARCKTS